MIYVSRITITLGTPERTPLSEEIDIPVPWVLGVWINFASGAAAVGCRLLDRGGAFLPAMGSPENWIRDNGDPVNLLNSLRYRLAEPGKLRVEAFNTTGADIELEVAVQAEPIEPAAQLADEFHAFAKDLREVIERMDRRILAIEPAEPRR